MSDDSLRRIRLSALLAAILIAALLTPLAVVAFRDSYEFGMFTVSVDFFIALPLLLMALYCPDQSPDACIDMERYPKTTDEVS